MRSHRMRGLAGNVGGIPTDGLVARWTMDNISGSTLIDEQGAYSGTIYGAAQVAGVDGQALSFDGIDDRVVVDPSPVLSQFSVSFWLRLKNTTSSKFILVVRYNQSDKQDYQITQGGGYRNGAITAAVWNNSGSLFERDFSTSPDTDWHLVTLAVSSSEIKYYYDASLSDTAAYTGTIAGRPNILGMGCWQKTSPSNFAEIEIDEVLYYNRPLTGAEVSKIYGA